jgi:hypothetical protein
VKLTFWLCVLMFIAGVVIVALPDNNERVFSFNESHGPALLDVAGLVFVMASWSFMMIYALVKWRNVFQLIGRPMAAATLAIGATGLMVTAVALAGDSGNWWIGALIAFAGQLAWIIAAFRKRAPWS